MSSFDDSAGRVIAGRYRLMSRIGVGGMGRVWLAYDLELACEVAVKEIVFAQDLPEPELAARVARARSEARMAARLRDHPHVATVHDVVEEDGLPWIVMAYVPGAKTLEEIVRERGPLDAPEAARVGLAVLDALLEGHRLGILHRDVKPANILLTPPAHDTPRHQGHGQILLADYGIALKPDSREPRLTAASGIVGTAGFLAPERARGAPPSAASDLFSLGATLYFAVTGNGPFDRDSEASTLTALLFEDPAPPQHAGGLVPVLTGLLAKRPEQRMDGEEAYRRLAEAVEPTEKRTVPPPTVPPRPPPGPREETVVVPRPDRTDGPPPEPPPPPWFHKPRRSRGGLIALLAVAALLIGGGVWAGTSLTSGGGAGGTNTPSPTGPVRLYGENVDLTKQLKPGDCVSAVWGQGTLRGEPNSVAVVDCVKAPDRVDGQVIKTDEATSADDAKQNGPSHCKTLLADLVHSMADAQSYALVPNEQGWDSGVHRTACLVFNKTAPLYGPAGAFRHTGAETYLTNSSVGDCINNKAAPGNTAHQYLAGCAAPHDEQVIGFVRTPDGMTYKSAYDQLQKLCSNKYASAYAKNPGEDLDAWITETDYNNGFRYVMCTVYRPDGKKLTGDLTSPVSFSGFSGVFGLAPLAERYAPIRRPAR